jgi:hypothetical protein
MTVRRGSRMLFLLLLPFPSSLAAQGSSPSSPLDTVTGALVRGTVYDSVSHTFLQGAVVQLQDCIPILWVDGTRDDKLEDQQLAMPRPHEIAVMEVYNGAAQVPAQLSGIGACGAVVIWTGE